MVNGITWEEETQARLRQAREKQKQAEDKCRVSEMEAKSYKEYADTLERVLELLGEQREIKENGQHVFDPERLRRQSVRDSLIEIASANNGLLVVVDAIPILVDAKVCTDREHARNSIYSNLNHYKRQFKKERPGVYRLVDAQSSLPDAHRLALLGIKEQQNDKEGGLYMECPAGDKYSDADSMNVAKHMMGIFDEPHIKSIEAMGLNPVELVRTGNYKLLAEALEKAAKRKS